MHWTRNIHAAPPQKAAVFPLYDTGTTGMQMCKIQGVMTDPDFHLRASAGSSQVTFKKQVEGAGVSPVAWRKPADQ